MSAPMPSPMERSTGGSGRLSAVAVDSADVALDERKMYAVEWRDGATFGFTVTPVNSDRGTVLLLARRTARREQLEAAGLQDVVPGDLLVGIGDERVYHLGADHAAKYLRSVKKPVRLTLQLSPYGNQAKQLPDLAPNEYHYLWEEGPLGIVLTYDTKSKLPMVKRLSDKANETVRRDVDVTDQLIYCNDVPTSEYSMDEVMSILREMPKPVLLRFRKQLQDDHLVELPELAENEYEFLWDYGPLGLVIGMSRSGLPFVRSFTGLGTSRQLNLVQEDDEIVMVNDKSALSEGFRETMQYLMNVPKPAVLRFRRKIRNTVDDRASQAIRASAIASNAARPSTPGYQQPSVPDCVGPLSPVAPLGASIQNFGSPSAHQPLSPQVRVSLDRSRFRSVSSARSSSGDDFPANSPSGPLVTTSSPRASVARASTTMPAAVTARQTIPLVTESSSNSIEIDGEQFEDARSPESTGKLSGFEERETAILPPDPRIRKSEEASRSSIFTFSFEDGPGLPPSAEPPRQRRISAKTGSMPPDPVVEPMASALELSRSQSSRPISNTPDVPAFVPLPEPPTNESVAAQAPAKIADSSTTDRTSGVSKPMLDTADIVAEPVVKTSAQQSSKRSYEDTADLVAEAAPIPPKSPVDNQREVGAKVAQPAKPAAAPSKSQIEDTAELVAEPVTKPVASPSKNQIEDTSELVAEPVAKSAKKNYVDTAELVAEPVKAEKPTPEPKQQYIDTAELFAEPPAPKKTAPVKKEKEYVDIADLVAGPVRAPATKKEYVDTADLVAVSDTPASKPKPAYIDTAELFAEPAAAKPAAEAAAPASAPAPVAAAPTPAPVQAKSTPAAPLKSASSTEGQEHFTVDPAAFYTVQWTDGPFGSTVREADSDTGPVMLITKRTGKSTCKGLRRIAVGDILVRIGDKEVSSMGFEKATRYLRKVAKPVPLTFQAID